jgi:catechol 2,3-dioxygenase-like lactoylglutathione lyase family enzyme
VTRTFAAAFLISTVAFAQATFAQTSAPAPDTGVPTVGILNYIHAVKDLETTLAFYREVFGLSGEPRPFPNPGVPTLIDSPGASLRLATLKLPNTPFGLELTQFSGVIRRPGQTRPFDPGAAILVLRVKNLDPIVAAVKKRNDPIVTTSGAPVTLGNTRVFMVRDPDGFLCHIVELPQQDVAPVGNIFGADIGLGIASKDSTARFYHDLLGFDLMGRDAYHSNPGYFDMIGGPANAQVREYRANVPGTKALVAFYEYKDVDRRPFHLRVPDPGAPAMALRVTGIEGLVERMRAAGVQLTSKNGQLVQFTPAIRNIFVVDPNGVNIELFEVSPAGAAKR